MRNMLQVAPKSAIVPAKRIAPGALATTFILRDLPGIAAIERVMTTVGAEWLPENDDLQQRIDTASIALFGITEGDTFRETPSYLYFVGDREVITDEVHDRCTNLLNAAQIEYAKWELSFVILYREEDDDSQQFWRVLGFDVFDSAGEQLACLHSFSRQMISVARELVPGAKFTPDGTGVRARHNVSTADWAAALERQAREFKSRNGGR